MALDETEYLQQQQALLPPGAAWSRDPDAEITNALAGMAKEYARIDARGDDLLREFNPATAVELLPEWEKEYGITPPEGATIEQRQQAVAYRYTAEGDIKKPYYVRLAASMGYAIRIDDYMETMVGWFRVGDELIFEDFGDFTAGISEAGETLGNQASAIPWIWNIVLLAAPAVIPSPPLEDVLEDLKPAHIKLNFTYP